MVGGYFLRFTGGREKQSSCKAQQDYWHLQHIKRLHVAPPSASWIRKSWGDAFLPSASGAANGAQLLPCDRLVDSTAARPLPPDRLRAPLASPANPLHNHSSPMRWLRLLGIVLA